MYKRQREFRPSLVCIGTEKLAGELKLLLSDIEDVYKRQAVITAGLVVSGDLDSVGSIDVFGTVEGNVACCGKLTVSGTIEGAIMANEVFANNAKISGDIQSKGSAKIGQGTVCLLYTSRAYVGNKLMFGDICMFLKENYDYCQFRKEGAEIKSLPL